MAQLIKQKQMRARVKGFLTRIGNSLTPDITSAEAKLKLDKVKDAWQQFEDIQTDIEENEPEAEDQIERFRKECEAERAGFEKQYFETAAKLQTIVDRENMQSQQQLQQTNNRQQDSTHQPHQGQQSTRIKPPRLPDLKLPEFDGDYTKWLFFKNCFETTVHNNEEVCNVRKHQYLLGVLKGEALIVVEKIELGDENYISAWNLLKNTYDNQALIIETHLDELFKFPDICKEDKADSLRKLNWHIQKHISSLKALKQPVDKWDTIIIHLAKKKLDYTEQRDWQELTKTRTPEKMPKLEEFNTFLLERSQSLMLLQQNKKKKTTQSQIQSTKTATSGEKSKKVVMTSTQGKCCICEEQHFIFQCNKFLNMSPEAREKVVIQKKHCINCLKYGHLAKVCRGSKCKKCDLPHNTLLHKESNNGETAEAPATVTVNHNINQCVNTATKQQTYTLLSTALVYVKDSKGNKVTCRALLDPGAQSNLITQECSKKLNLKYTKEKIHIHGVNQTKSEATRATNIQIISMHTQYTTEAECLVLSSITDQLPHSKINVDKVFIPRNINLADPEFHEPGNIDLLIGAGIYWKILIGSPRNHLPGQPALQNTKLGWIFGGNLHDTTEDTTTTCFTITNQQLAQQIEKFWKQESIEDKQYMTKEEKYCEKQFFDTVDRDSTGRFIVRLPTRPDIILGSSKEQARKRLEALERRFVRQPGLKQAYCAFMDEYETLGHMSRIEIPQERRDAYFIPHQAVIRPESSSTKLRVVFDASAKTSSGTSLNDKLIVGPNLQGDLLHIILRFRMHKFVITADIEKMFRQILIHKDDRPLQQILWRTNNHLPIQTFQLNTVTYGTASAPFHAMRCLRELAIIYQQQYPLAAEAIQKDFYMDDCISGGNSLSIVKQLQQQLLELLGKGQMLLRKWRSNDQRLLQQIDKQQNSNDLMILDKGEASKTLGLLWNSTQDTLQYHVEPPKRLTDTKRAVLSSTAQIYDPVGLLGPVLITGKIIMQQLWADGLEWDQPLTPAQSSAWNNYNNSLPALNNITISRNFNPDNSATTFNIFGFSDASEKAFGACLYAVSQTTQGIAQSHLIASKTKVAPLKTISLPRLELEAALLLSKLLQEAKTAFSSKVNQIHLWSDSTIVLGWIQTQPHLLKTFVANRVTKIQDATEDIKWNHVPSEQNPADLLSRGTTPQQLKNSSLWWFGPDWLIKSDPQPDNSSLPATELPEMKASTVVMAMTFTSTITHRFSSFSKLCRIIAYCHRFIYNTIDRTNAKIGHLLPEEIQKAEKTIIRWTQEETFTTLRQCLINYERLPRKNPIKALDPFIDEDGLIRVGGRLKFADLTKEQKHPAILPANHHITTAIIREEHIRLRHCPPEQLLHAVRRKYWPIGGRRETQKIVRKCLQCFRFCPQTPEVRMGDLPKERVLKVTRPFYITGVDYAGPFQLRESRRRGRIQIHKAYVAVFTCFSTKAVHLELVSDLTTEAFIAAMQRFTARRGICTQVYSDNGRNFVGAANALKELQFFLQQESEVISSALASQQITWQFIPPRSPHFGGLWEAAVKIMKRHLYTETQGRVLTFEEHYTLLCDVEAILNSRPLTPLTKDPNDFEVLTPAHFIIGDSLIQPVQANHTQTPDSHLSRWQHLQKIRQKLWQRWQIEYLQELQKRSKWNVTDRRVDIDSLVLIIEEGVPALKWPRGRVIQTHPGPDGEVRVVTVKTSTGTFTRSIKKLCLLPIQDSEQEN